MIVEDIPFKQMFRFEAKPVIRQSMPISTPASIPTIATLENQINWGKIIGIAAVVGISGYIAYKIWKHYDSIETEKKSYAFLKK